MYWNVCARYKHVFKRRSLGRCVWAVADSSVLLNMHLRRRLSFSKCDQLEYVSSTSHLPLGHAAVILGLLPEKLQRLGLLSLLQTALLLQLAELQFLKLLCASFQRFSFLFNHRQRNQIFSEELIAIKKQHPTFNPCHCAKLLHLQGDENVMTPATRPGGEYLHIIVRPHYMQ